MDTQILVNCPACQATLEGDLIYETFLKMYNGNESRALEASNLYGATKTTGRWGRQIALYSREQDRTYAYQCPDCRHQWPR